MLQLAALSLSRPTLTLLLLLLVSTLLGSGAMRLESEAGYRAFLGADHPALRELDATIARFGAGLPIAAVWSCAEPGSCDSVFDARSLAMAHDVARRLESTPGVRRVDGPATSPLLTPVFLELPEVRRLAPDGAPAPDLDDLAQRALDDPLWSGQIVSSDGLSGAILVHLEDTDADRGARVVGALQQILAPYEAAGFRFHLVGGPVEFVVAGGELARDTARVMPLMVGLVALVLVLLFRSWREAAIGLVCVGVALAWTLGLMGWLGWPQNSFTQALAPLVLVIGVCDAMHVLAATATHLSRSGGSGRADREAALLESVRAVGTPCLLTTLTTAAGFASFAASGLESFVRFGWLAAFGVCAALVVCFTLLPLLVVALPLRRRSSRRSTAAWERGLEALVRVSARRASAVLGVTALLAAAGTWGFAQLRVDASFEDLYGENSQVVRWVKSASRYLRAPETLEVAATPPEGTPAHALEALRVVSGIETLGELEGLGAPLSILTPMRELHLLVHGGPLSLAEDETSRERARSMLRILRFEDRELVGFLVDPDGGYRVSIQAQKLPQDTLRKTLASVRAQLDETLPPGWTVTVTGPLAVVGEMIDEIRSTQLRSFALAGVLVLAIVAVFFRSLAIAALAVVPGALPVLLTLGGMGLVGIPLDVGTAMVAAVLLGLAVDDAIHLLTSYQRQRVAGHGPEDAAGSAVREVGRALVTSSAALAVGFLVLALSPWQSLASFGFVAAVAIAAALAAVLVVLPALLSVGRRSPRSAGPTGSA